MPFFPDDIIFRDLSWVKIYNVDQRYEANRINGKCLFLFYLNTRTQII